MNSKEIFDRLNSIDESEKEFLTEESKNIPILEYNKVARAYVLPNSWKELLGEEN